MKIKIPAMPRMLRAPFLFALLVFDLSAQGLHFEQLDWAAALEKARIEQKLIFLDAVTSWCGPCKLMSKEVFPDSMLGAFFNKRFINLKLDMERGEGVDLSNRYRVWVYPSLLFIDSTGAVAHRSAGYHKAGELLDLAAVALDPARNLAGLEKQYLSGNRRRAFLLQYLKAKSAAFDPDAGRLANEYLKNEADLAAPENMDLIMQHVDDPFSKSFQFLLKNRAVFEDKYEKRAVKLKVESVFESYLQQHPDLPLGEVQRLYATIYPEGAALLASRYRLEYHRKRKETIPFVTAALDHYQRYPSEDPDELNEMASIFAEETKDKSALQTALSWVEKALSIQETSYYRYTQAKVFAAMSKKNAARKAALRSKALAEKEGEDGTLAEELLQSLKTP